MEINLLPRKSFVEKRFFLLTVIVFLLLSTLGYVYWQMYLLNNYEHLSLQLELQTKKTEKEILLDNMGWNEEVKKYDEQVQDIKRYQLLIDGLHHLEVDWSTILLHIQGLIDSAEPSISFSTQGNYLNGMVVLEDLESAAAFIEQLSNYEAFQEVYIDLVQLQTENEAQGYEVTFSAYLNLLSF